MTNGTVREPGPFPMAPDMSASGAVNNAGLHSRSKRPGQFPSDPMLLEATAHYGKQQQSRRSRH